MKPLLTSLCVAAAFISTVNAQQNKTAVVSNFAANANARVTVNEDSGIPKFIKFSPNSALRVSGTTTTQKTFNFLEENKSMFDLESVSEALKLQRKTIDQYGLENISLQQEYKGVPVFDGVLRFHYDSSANLTAVNGNVLSISKLNPIPKVSKTEAAKTAINLINSQDINFSGDEVFDYDAKLYVFQKGLIEGYAGKIHLVYEVEVRNDNDVREFVYVDAHNGSIVQQFTGMAHALKRELYEKTLEASTKQWEEGDTYPGELSKWQKNEITTSGHVYYFFKNVFGRDSYDDKGATMITLNNADDINCPNANWNGIRAGYCDGTAADDVIAHEWGHAYTQFTSGLIYAFQSGAMNESFSDVWGETIDLINNYEDEGEDLSKRTGCNSSDRWRMGEDATSFNGAIRDMWKPSCDNDPDSMATYKCKSADDDAGGVHTNSGIPNHAYALLVDGGNYNGQTIKGIGLTKAAHIFWRAQTEYLTSTSDFTVLANALEASGEDLIGKDLKELTTTAAPAATSNDKITADDVAQLKKAIIAVDLRKPLYDKCTNFEPLLAKTPELCNNAERQPIFKEDWEAGLGNWTLEQLPVKASSWTARDWALNDALPDNREGKAAFAINPVIGDCKEDLQNGIIRLESPEIIIKDYQGGKYEMAFTHYVAIENEYDGGNIKYSVNGSDWKEVPKSAFSHNAYNQVLKADENDNPMSGQNAFSGADGGTNTGSWGTSILSLTELGVKANDKFKVRFELGTDGCNGTVGWYVDDVVIYNCDGKLSTTTFNELSDLVSVYPNPSTGVYTLQVDGTVNVTKAEIYDINGRLIKTVDLLNTTTVNLTNAASGVYFMSVYSNTEKGMFKLIKK